MKLLKFKKIIKTSVQWGMALIFAFLIMNLIVACYHSQGGWIDRDSASTLGIRIPGSLIVMGTEGRGIYRVDDRGYINDNLPLDEDYTLVVGASYTQGFEVKNGERFTDILNERLRTSDEVIKVYNVSQSAYYFPDVIGGFSALNQEFPEAENIVIEIGTTNYTVEELKYAQIQRNYDEMQQGENIISTLPLKKRLTLLIREYCPLVNILQSQMEQIIDKNANKDVEGTEVASQEVIAFNYNDYATELDSIFKLMKSKYSGNIIILFHPNVSMDEGGKLIIKESETTKIFESVCDENGMEFVNATEAFYEQYDSEHSVPYGFQNTELGNGHLNASGHKILADLLYNVLKGE